MRFKLKTLLATTVLSTAGVFGAEKAENGESAQSLAHVTPVQLGENLIPTTIAGASALIEKFYSHIDEKRLGEADTAWKIIIASTVISGKEAYVFGRNLSEKGAEYRSYAIESLVKAAKTGSGKISFDAGKQLVYIGATEEAIRIFLEIASTEKGNERAILKFPSTERYGEFEYVDTGNFAEESIGELFRVLGAIDSLEPIDTSAVSKVSDLSWRDISQGMIRISMYEGSASRLVEAFLYVGKSNSLLEGLNQLEKERRPSENDLMWIFQIAKGLLSDKNKSTIGRDEAIIALDNLGKNFNFTFHYEARKLLEELAAKSGDFIPGLLVKKVNDSLNRKMNYEGDQAAKRSREMLQEMARMRKIREANERVAKMQEAS